MCALPHLGRFDLITCLDESLDYVVEPELLRNRCSACDASSPPAG